MHNQYRIAFCFSGQLREWRAAYPSIKKFLDLFDSPPDKFCHFWDFNSTSHAVMFNTGENLEFDLEEGELQQAIETFAPTKFLVEDREKSRSIEVRAYESMKLLAKLNEGEDIPDSPYWLAPQYYGISQASILKQKYELENNFTYDLVIRMRYDSFITDDFIEMFLREDIEYIKPFTIFSSHCEITDKFPFVIVGDVFYMCDSLSFNIVADYVNHLPNVFLSMPTKKPRPEDLFAFYIKSNFFKIRPLEGDIKVKRPETYFRKLGGVGVKPYDCDI